MIHCTIKKALLFLAVLLLTGNPAMSQLEQTKLIITGGIDNEQLKTTMENNVSLLLSMFNKAAMDGKKLSLSPVVFTKDAQELIPQIWKSSGIICSLSSLERNCLTLPDGRYQIRNIPVSMLAADPGKQEQEIVINFTAIGLIDNVNVALPEHQYTDVIANNVSVTDFRQRQIIVEFVENFRTSYNRKDIKLIETIFSDNALIITGKVVKVIPNSDGSMKSLSKEKIVYQTQTKQQYITGLKRVFSRNKYLNILFDEIEVLRHPKYPDLYGVTLKQEWNSTTYSDVGYVFLMIDFENEKEPHILVRTWQPEMFQGKKLSRDEIFNLDSFNIEG